MAHEKLWPHRWGYSYENEVSKRTSRGQRGIRRISLFFAFTLSLLLILAWLGRGGDQKGQTAIYMLYIYPV